MLAARLYGKKDLRVEDVATPSVEAGGILLKVRSASICGTDVRMYQNGRSGPGAESPLILGHEISGEVAAVGAGLRAYRQGMRVAVGPNIGCGVCDLCVSGNTHMCPAYVALGIHIDGGFAQYVAIPAGFVQQGNVVEIAEGVSCDEASLAEPLSCVFNAFERSRLRPGDTVLIFGAGPIGIMHAKLARLGGAAKVMVNDLDAARLEQCRRIVPSVIPLSGENLRQQVMDLTAGRGVDVCITACAAPAAQEAAIDLAAINGRIIFFGGLPKDKSMVRIDGNKIHYRQLIVTGTTRASLAQYRRALELVAGGLISLRELISSTCTIDQCPQALENAARAAGLKSVIHFD